MHYYFRSLIRETETALTLVSLYSPPDRHLFEFSYRTLLSCKNAGDACLQVIDIKFILSVVAMVPHLPFPGDTSERYFVVEKPGLDVASLGGVVEDVPDDSE